MIGKIKFYNSVKGYGFITEDETEIDFFFHVTGLLENKIKSTTLELTQANKELDKLVELAIAGTLTKATIKKKEQTLIEVKNSLEDTLRDDTQLFNSMPDVNTVKKEAEKIRRQLLEYFSGKKRLEKMTYNEKRMLLHWLFEGRDKKGTPYGKYISKTGQRKEAKVDYFLYGKVQGLRTLKGDDIDYFDDKELYKTNKGVDY